ncbi:type II toxin-antitoxin system VapC family toxin [Thermococcus thermotolerans]|uniref:type II toxin-antitoxin system VapC family toxin n=1 Tax=Thermococcus thermotolerans TaxID=2969672 RepID=UPI002157FC16|nr:PIN domain-containing protein [Thermococcus thermotolerans]
MFLVDTNVFLEILLEQENSDTAEEFLRKTPSEFIYLSDFTLYSIGIIMTRAGKEEIFPEFVEDITLNGGFTLLRLPPLEFRGLVDVMKRFNLDFDDAYQYRLAELYNLKIVSFDSDFDGTELGRITPGQALKAINTLREPKGG